MPALIVFQHFRKKVACESIRSWCFVLWHFHNHLFYFLLKCLFLGPAVHRNHFLASPNLASSASECLCLKLFGSASGFLFLRSTGSSRTNWLDAGPAVQLLLAAGGSRTNWLDARPAVKLEEGSFHNFFDF